MTSLRKDLGQASPYGLLCFVLGVVLTIIFLWATGKLAI